MEVLVLIFVYVVCKLSNQMRLNNLFKRGELVYLSVMCEGCRYGFFSIGYFIVTFVCYFVFRWLRFIFEIYFFRGWFLFGCEVIIKESYFKCFVRGQFGNFCWYVVNILLGFFENRNGVWLVRGSWGYYLKRGIQEFKSVQKKEGYFLMCIFIAIFCFFKVSEWVQLLLEQFILLVFLKWGGFLIVVLC